MVRFTFLLFSSIWLDEIGKKKFKNCSAVGSIISPVLLYLQCVIKIRARKNDNKIIIIFYFNRIKLHQYIDLELSSTRKRFPWQLKGILTHWKEVDDGTHIIVGLSLTMTPALNIHFFSIPTQTIELTHTYRWLVYSWKSNTKVYACLVLLNIITLER